MHQDTSLFWLTLSLGLCGTTTESSIQGRDNNESKWEYHPDQCGHKYGSEKFGKVKILKRIASRFSEYKFKGEERGEYGVYPELEGAHKENDNERNS